MDDHNLEHLMIVVGLLAVIGVAYQAHRSLACEFEKLRKHVCKNESAGVRAKVSPFQARSRSAKGWT